MKKYIALVLTLVVVFSLTGCNVIRQDDGIKVVKSIVDGSKKYDYPDVIEEFYEDENYIYSFGAPISEEVIVIYTDGSKQNVKEALDDGNITITDLDTYGIQYFADSKQEEGITEFKVNAKGEIHTTRVKITEWQSDGFIGVVTDYTRYDAYDIGTELLVKFDEDSFINVYTDEGLYAAIGIPESQINPVGNKVYISFDKRKISSETSESSGETKIVVYVHEMTSEYFY